MQILIAAVPGLVVGFAAGLLSFKVKTTWCQIHGLSKICPDCLDLQRAAADQRRTDASGR